MFYLISVGCITLSVIVANAVSLLLTMRYLRWRSDRRELYCTMCGFKELSVNEPEEVRRNRMMQHMLVCKSHPYNKACLLLGQARELFESIHKQTDHSWEEEMARQGFELTSTKNIADYTGTNVGFVPSTITPPPATPDNSDKLWYFVRMLNRANRDLRLPMITKLAWKSVSPESTNEEREEAFQNIGMLLGEEDVRLWRAPSNQN